MSLTAKPSRRRSSRSKSGTPSLFGLGTLSLTTVLFAETISWISVSSVKRTKHLPLARNAPWPGASATMLSTFTAFRDGSRLDRYAHWITEIGNSKSMADSRSEYIMGGPCKHRAGGI